MEGQSLADHIIDRRGSSQSDEKFSLDSAPDRFFRLHPSTCWVGDHIVCDHEVVAGDTRQLVRLLDHPQARLDYAATAWLFERIKERAPRLNERYIMVSEDFIWDRQGSKLITITVPPKTTNNIKSRKRLEKYDERRSVEGVGQDDGGNPIYTGEGDARGDGSRGETIRGGLSYF